MSRLETYSDEQLIEWIEQVRAEHDACTIGALAKHTGLSTSGLNQRIQPLLESHLLTRTGVPGSLRPTAAGSRKVKAAQRRLSVVKDA